MRQTFRGTSLVLSGAMVASLGAAGCSDLPGSKKTQGAVIGGATGAVAGAVIGGHGGRLIGGLLGGAVGAGGGYLIGAQLEKGDSAERDKATKAAKNAETNPVTAEQARQASTADVNGDGYVTMDEVVAMRKAGFTDTEMIDRLQRTGMFFELTPEQQKFLRDNGVSQRVIDEMQTMNADARRRASERIGSAPPPATAPAPAASPPPSLPPSPPAGPPSPGALPPPPAEQSSQPLSWELDA